MRVAIIRKLDRYAEFSMASVIRVELICPSLHRFDILKNQKNVRFLQELFGVFIVVTWWPYPPPIKPAQRDTSWDTSEPSHSGLHRLWFRRVRRKK